MADYQMNTPIQPPQPPYPTTYVSNTLAFGIGIAETPEGYVGRIYHGGVEVWETPSPFADKEQAHRHAVKHLSRRLAATLQS